MAAQPSLCDPFAENRAPARGMSGQGSQLILRNLEQLYVQVGEVRELTDSYPCAAPETAVRVVGVGCSQQEVMITAI